MNPIVYDVYQFFFHIGRYGEHKRVATFNNELDAQRRVDQIWSTGESVKPILDEAIDNCLGDRK